MKKLMVLLLTVVIVLGLVGCAAKTDPPTANDPTFDAPGNVTTSGEPVKIELWYQGSNDTSAFYQIAKKALDEYMLENSNFYADIVPGGEADVYLQKVLMSAATGSLPETFAATPFNLAGIPETGVLYNITDIIDSDPEWSSRFSDQAWELQFKFTGGEKYGVPMYSELQGWFLNKRLFDELGLEIPVAYEDWLHCIDKFYEAGITPIAYGAADTWSRWGFDIWFQRYGFTENLDQILSGELKFSDFALPIYEKIDEMSKHHAFPENVSTASHTEAMALFKEGKAAMITVGSWALDELLESEDAENFVFSWGPEFSDSQYDQKVGTKAISWTCWVGNKAADSEEKLAAVTAYLKKMSDPDVANYLAEEKHIIPACQFEVDTESLPGLMVSILEKKDDNYASGGEIAGSIDASFETVYWNTVSAVITQTATPEEAVQMLDDAMSALS